MRFCQLLCGFAPWKNKKTWTGSLTQPREQNAQKRVFWDTTPWTWWIMHLCWQLKFKQISAICMLSAKPLLLHPLTCRIKPCGTVRNVNPGWINRIQRTDCTQRLGKTVALNINRQHSTTRTPIKTRGLIKGHQIYQSFTTFFPEWGSCMNHGGLLWVSLFERVIGRFPHLISHDEFKCYPTHLDTSDVNNYIVTWYMIHTPLNPVCPLFCRFEPQVLPKENWVVLWVSGIYIYNICKYPPHTKIHLQDFTTIK